MLDTVKFSAFLAIKVIYSR